MSSLFNAPPPSVGNIGLGPRRISLRGFISVVRPDYTANMRLLYGLIALNIGIFGYACHLQTGVARKDPRRFATFMQNFTIKLQDIVRDRRWWTVVTSCFAHLSLQHLFGNMVSARCFGQVIAMTPGVGPATFLMLVIGSGLAGSAGFLILRATRARKRGGRDYHRALGFSGVVMGLGSAAACLDPHRMIVFRGMIPVPTWVLVLGYTIYDGYYLNQEESGISHSGHLGGLSFGLAYYYLKLRGLVENHA